MIVYCYLNGKIQKLGGTYRKSECVLYFTHQGLFATIKPALEMKNGSIMTIINVFLKYYVLFPHQNWTFYVI